MVVLLNSLFCLIILSSIGVVWAKNPVKSVLFLISVFFFCSLFFFFFGSSFLGIILLIIYVGALSILFLFVVMMFDVHEFELESSFFRPLPLALFFVFLFVSFFLFMNLNSFYLSFNLFFDWFFCSLSFFGFTKAHWVDLIFVSESSLVVLGIFVFNYYFVAIFLIGLLLLVAMLGCIALTLDFNVYVTVGAAVSHEIIAVPRGSNDLFFWKPKLN